MFLAGRKILLQTNFNKIQNMKNTEVMTRASSIRLEATVHIALI